MPKEYFGDTLFGYLLGTLYTSFSDEETERILKNIEEGRDIKADEVLSTRKVNDCLVRG